MLFSCFISRLNHEQKLPDEESSSSTTSSTLAVGPSTENSQEQDDKDSDKDPKKKKNRCAMCRKKVGLTGECFCVFPIKHVFIRKIRLQKGLNAVVVAYSAQYIDTVINMNVHSTTENMGLRK